MGSGIVSGPLITDWYHFIFVYVTDDLSIEEIEGFYHAWVSLRLDDWRLCRV